MLIHPPRITTEPKKQNPDEIASAGLYFIFYLNVAT